MKYNPEIHHRKSIRLKGYDYSQSGMYYTTICIKNRECFYGEIINGTMICNDAGKMIEKWYHKLSEKFPDIDCGEYIVMPNHFHCIIINNGTGNPNISPVRADPRVCPNKTGEPDMGILGEPDMGILGEHMGSPLHRVVQWFKTMATNEYIRGVKNMNWPRFDGKLFQRNYWERIVRNNGEYHRIRQYIRNNPANWRNDKFYS